MFSKIYLAFMVLSVAIISFFTYYSWSWLQSKGNPADAAAAYGYHSGLSWTVLLISSLALILLANAVLWATQRGWAMWLSLIYFSVFVTVAYFWLGESFFHFKKENGMSDGSFSLGPFFAVALIAIAAVVVFFDQFIVVRLHRKMYGKGEATTEIEETALGPGPEAAEE